MNDHLQRMERLVHVVIELSQTRSLQAIMDIVKHAARDLTGSDGITFVLRDGDKCHYADEAAIGPLWKGQRFPLTACISGWAMLNRQAAFIPDIYKDPRIPVDAYRPTFVKSLAMMPIRTESPIGAIGCYWASEHVTTTEEIKLLQALANTVSVSMENLELIGHLERSNALFNAFMDHAPFAALVSDKSGESVYANHNMRQLPASCMSEVEIEDGTDMRRQVSVVTASGMDTQWWVTKFSIPQGTSEPKIGTIAIDITDRVTAEREREEIRVKLQHAYKMATLGEMAGGIAHEVNNPLSIIIGRARQLSEVLEDDPPGITLARDFSKVIVDTSQRIVSIVNGLSTISRQAERDPCIMAKLSSIIDGTMAVIAAKFKHGNVALSVKDYDRSMELECRPPEISQVLLNLLSNAFDAIAHLEDKWVEVDIRTDNEWVVIAITDSGSGIPGELQEKILAPFFTTKAFGHGCGLGLSISKGIVEGHGGDLAVDRNCQNTRFLARFPIIQGGRKHADIH